LVLELELELELMASIGIGIRILLPEIPIHCLFVLNTKYYVETSWKTSNSSISIKDSKFTISGVNRQYFLRCGIQKFKGHRSRSVGMGFRSI
jgi:hypothetical protein